MTATGREPSDAKPRAAVIGLGSMGSGMALVLNAPASPLPASMSARTPWPASRRRAAGRQHRPPPPPRVPTSSSPSSSMRAQTEAVLFGPAGVADSDAGRVRLHLVRDHGAGPRAGLCRAARGTPVGTISTPRSAAVPRAPPRARSPSWHRAVPDAFAWRAPGARRHGREALRTRRRSRTRRGLQDGEPAPRRHSHRRCRRGDRVRRAPGPRPREGLRGHHRFGRQLLDVRESHSPCPATRIMRREAPSTSSSRISASCRTWPARRAFRCRWRRRHCRCSSRPRPPAWAATTMPPSTRLYARITGATLPGEEGEGGARATRAARDRSRRRPAGRDRSSGSCVRCRS